MVKGIESILGEKYRLTKTEDNKKEGNEYRLSMYEVLKDYSIYLKNRCSTCFRKNIFTINDKNIKLQNRVIK